MCQEDVQTVLLSYVREQCYSDVELDSDLLESGYVDSLLVMDLMLYIQSRFQVALQAADLAPRHFRSVNRLASLVSARQATTAG